MPLVTNPNAICVVVLKSDVDKPPAEQPKFYYNCLTGIQQLDLARKLDEMEKMGTGVAALQEIFDAARTGLCGWTNMYNKQGKAVEFAPDKLEEIIGMSEASELAYKLMAQIPTVEDKKKFDSPSPSSSDRPAKTAKASTSAQTSPQK